MKTLAQQALGEAAFYREWMIGSESPLNEAIHATIAF